MNEYETIMSEFIMQIDNTLSVTDGRLNEIFVLSQQIIENQNKCINALQVYVGCLNVILMVLLLLRVVPEKKGSVKNANKKIV